MRSLFLAWLSFSMSMTILDFTESSPPPTSENGGIQGHRFMLMNCYKPPESQRVAAECAFWGYYPLEPVTSF